MSRRLLTAVALICATTLAPTATGRPREPEPAATLRVAGLREAVEVLRDRWGVNHIYAKSEHDLFFAQGYCAARDRLFQLELWRREATGTVAEVLGPKELKRDIGARLHMFRGDLKEELSWYHPRGEAIVSAFVAGINAYVDEALRAPADLPIEFQVLGLKPGRWTNDVVVSRHRGLFGSVHQELYTAMAIRALGVEPVKRSYRFYGGEPSLSIDPSIDLSLLNENIVELYNAFRGAPIRFTPEHVTPEHRARAQLTPERHDTATLVPPVDLSQRPEDIGSNAWVVGGRLTSSGLPLLASDPHRPQSIPSLRSIVHLVAPGWNVIGGSEPMLPGVSIGHNEHGAWGLTIFGTDTEDLYVYDTNPANPNQYRYRGDWLDMRIIKEVVRVKGGEPVTVDLKYTRHGPVLYEDKPHRKAYALRAAWMDVGGAPYLASLRLNQAANWSEFREACRYARIPAEDFVWADTSGNVGHQAAAVTPIRRNWSGFVPVPGDGRYEWDGYLPIPELPHAFNPEQGFWASANNYQFPRGYPHKEAQHHVAADPFRAHRITEFLASGRRHTVADMMRLQNDDLSIPARAIVQLLNGLELTDPAVTRARDALLGWDAVLDKGSTPAGIYEMFQRRLLANARDTLMPKEAESLGGIGMSTLIDLLVTPDGRFGRDPIADRDQLLATSLEQAVAELTRRLGPDPAQWQYGNYHHALLTHPLGPALDANTRKSLEVGPMPRGGDSYTVSATGGGDNQTGGGSLKLIVDLYDWDRSVALNNPGQSGDPRSPHYKDLFALWARGKYFPLFFSRARLESVAETRETLTPSGAARAR